MRRTLVVMVKSARPGRVKTRLGHDIGMVPAAWWFRHQTRALLRRLADPRWRIVLAVSPDRDVLARHWPPHLTRRAQGGGDLGRRMLAQLAAAPRGHVCLIGADLPDLRRQHIARAFAVLGGHDLVFGPALDGGFWLIGAGMLRPARGALDGVRWSSEHALADSLTALRRHRVALTDRLADVDTVADLARFSR